MSKVLLKTAPRKTSVSRLAVRKAVAAAFDSSNKKTVVKKISKRA